MGYSAFEQKDANLFGRLGEQMQADYAKLVSGTAQHVAYQMGFKWGKKVHRAYRNRPQVEQALRLLFEPKQPLILVQGILYLVVARQLP
jgi:hypothetical protein